MWSWEQARNVVHTCPTPASPSLLGNRDSTLARGPQATERTHCLHRALPVTSQITGKGENKHSTAVAVSAPGSSRSWEDAAPVWPPIPAAGWQGAGAWPPLQEAWSAAPERFHRQRADPTQDPQGQRTVTSKRPQLSMALSHKGDH